MPDSTSYPTIVEKMEIYLDSIKPFTDSVVFYSGSGEYKRFKKFKKVWEPRINAYGSFESFYQAQSQFYDSDIYNYDYITERPWQELGPKRLVTSGLKGIGPVESITFFDNNSTESTRHMLVTSLMGGLYYSDNYGETWVNGGTDVHPWVQSGCGWAVFHPQNHEIWYASSSGNDAGGHASWSGNGGIYRTMNKGQDWELIADKTEFGIWTKIFKILIDPQNPKILFAATSSGIYKTYDCEASDPIWRKVRNKFTYDLEMKPFNNGILYAACYHGTTEGWKIEKSHDFGENFIPMTNQPALLNNGEINENGFTIEVSKEKPNYLYLQVRASASATFYYFDFLDNNNWNLITTGVPTSHGWGHGFGVDQVVNGETIIVSNGTVLRGFDLNGNNIPVGSPVHPDVEDVIFHPYNENEVWICTHGGVEKSIIGVQSWQPKYEGLGVAMVENFASSYSDPGVILAGLYHDGVQLVNENYSKNWNPDWKWLSGFPIDGMLPIIDHTNPNYMWGSGQQGKYWKRTTDRFNTIFPVTPQKDVFWQSIGTLNKFHPNIFYRNAFQQNAVPIENVFRSSNRGAGHGEFISNLELFIPEASQTNILEIKAPFTNENYLYVYLYHKETGDNTQYFHLFRTKNVMADASSVVWEELNIPSRNWISGLDFDPENPDIVYLSYGSTNQGQQQVYRIDYTNSNTEITKPLTGNLPISASSYNALAVINNGNGGLFFSTEFGVFYTDNDLQQQTENEWYLVGKELPRVIPKGLDINYISNTLRVGTYGRGMWEIGLHCLNKPEIIEITQNTTWDSYMRLDRGVKVGYMSTLTITEEARIAMPAEGKIIVEPGGKLIVNGGTITSGCEYPWQGIEVWGNSVHHQWPNSNGTYMQGYVELNNATIENAICAIDLWKSGDNTKTGGIVHATNSVFLNNAESVHALLYRNFNPSNGKEMEYNSWFKNCTFEITSNYPATHTFFKHVDLNQVNGIKFNSCDFSLSKEATNISNFNQAIAAYSAGFKVDAMCTSGTTPCSQWKKSNFTGFRVGVYAGNGSLKNYTYMINRALFTGNSIGILSNAVNNPIIINSEFYSAKNQYNWEDCTYGIFIEAASGFTIEDNYFFKQTGALQSNYIGIGAFNCQAVADVYRNTFTGLTAGNYAYGKNWAVDLYNGLEYLCNTNTSNWADFYVTGPEVNRDKGIQSKQGSTIMPARNSFSPTGATWHFRNLTENLIGYYYCQSCPGHYPQYVENVTREPVSVSGGCPPHYGSETPSSDIVLSTTSKLNAETEFAFTDLNLQDIKTLYNNLKDGGSTEDTKADVETALPSDMLELRAKLLGDSPHLSTEVLKLVADRTDVFTEAAIFDILAANPDELKKEELIKYLEEMENPLPEYMISILKQVAEGSSYRTVLEMEMAKYTHDRARAAGDIIRSILNAEELDGTQLRLWLTNLGGIDAERQIIATYTHQGEYSLALALAETLPATYHLEGEALLAHNQFVSLLQLQQNLSNSERTFEQLTLTEQDMLREVALKETSVSSSMAKSILESFYGESFARCKSIDGTASYKNQVVSPNQLAQAYGLSITVKPNPAREWAAFDYTLPEGDETATLEVVDASGKSVETYILKGSRGQKLLDTRTWPAGQYIYTLRVAGFTQSGKLIVAK
jgi:hypothetical protein